MRDVQNLTLRAINITPFASQLCPDRFGVCAFMAGSRLRFQSVEASDIQLKNE